MSSKPISEPADQVPPSAAVHLGVARRRIDPPSGIYARNWGAARHDTAEGIHGSLLATVLVIRGQGSPDPLILASLDLGWWQQAEDEWLVRGALIESLCLRPERVMLSCIHTHAGASLCSGDADKPGGNLIQQYLHQLRDSLMDATREALDRMAPGTLSWTTGRCDLAANRDLPDPLRNRILCGYNPAKPADDTVLVGRATDEKGRLLATIVNYACHPTTLAWDNRLISADYVGPMRELVESHTEQAPCLFLQGASGELAPREQYTGDLAIAESNGRRLGYAVLAALESMLPPRTKLAYAGVVESGAALATWRREPFDPSKVVLAEQVDVELPLKPLPSEEELRRQLAECSDRVMAERIRRKMRVVHMVGSGPTTQMPAWIWRIGDAILVGQPNEACSAFQTELRRMFPRKAVVVMNLVNGCCGYLSPPELHDLDIYQVWQSPFDRQALPCLIETCRERISSMLPCA
ncbi:MAG TPA: neutral/alkaline non-lysosomal ceramidase N-terminal domain-containing protein [Phycisphaerae bacterium]|nr:neutral/alkaline non-lysosomal ceramidase N-terminal domain-containing protein [Phycisphaerae bacterium]HRR87217.1 neutral/alkaline non-lysosomal ceramidase N-terminal domain-containing protein [Phycisphaerae bacterium]